MIKAATRLASLLIVAGVLVFFSNCGGSDPKPSREEQQLTKLKKEWSITGASFEGDDTRINDFTNFKLNLSGVTFNKNSPKGPYNYTLSGSKPDPGPWSGSGGNFELFPGVSGDTGTLARGDGVAITYNINSSGHLSLAFFYGGDSGGRTEQIIGDWVFTFQ
ncbi:MAG: hypothetical protein KF845_07820 [Cyclobacteriaceae bacterium]|nr:hypothetical protein [Cyclobacteriaceae bacterium]